jgi:hypothetical protein
MDIAELGECGEQAVRVALLQVEVLRDLRKAQRGLGARQQFEDRQPLCNCRIHQAA